MPTDHQKYLVACLFIFFGGDRFQDKAQGENGPCPCMYGVSLHYKLSGGIRKRENGGRDKELLDLLKCQKKRLLKQVSAIRGAAVVLFFMMNHL